jgi:NADP-dependent 3-hydroxy acid dehydrogenase YdfG
MRPLTGDDIAEVVVFAATRPPHVDIAEVLVLPTDQAAATHVFREE